MLAVITHKTCRKQLVTKGLLLIYCLLLSISNHAFSLEFDSRERSYLNQNSTLKVCQTQTMTPFDPAHHDGTNITSRYISIIKKTWLINTQIILNKDLQQSIQRLKLGQCDLIAAQTIQHSTKNDLRTTQAYLTNQLVFITDKSTSLVKSINAFEQKTVAVLAQYMDVDQLIAEFPDINFIIINDTNEGIELIQQEKAQALIGPLAVVGYYLQNNFHADIKINGQLERQVQIAMAVRKSNHILQSLINKTLSHLSREETAKINNQWIQVNYQHQVNYNLFFSVVILGGLLFIGLLYRHILLSQHTKQLTKISQTDKLTGLYNRVKTDEALIYHINSFRRYNDVFSIILLDLDNFKLINDQYGHMTGDQTLIKVAKVLLRSCRNTDIIGRWGGEEFLIICPKADLQRTRQITEKLRKNIEKILLTETPYPQNLSASFGVAEILIEDTHNSLILRADKALMQAKQNGKNQLVVAGKDLPVELIVEC